ncbi:MAG TPA: EAL domain-containing protein [Gammaproteobacteria bacterium]|nr:EAL domain-containing protein [Gammaproteobacteria bacterium]
MDLTADQRQISTQEKTQINQQVKAELIEHLYRGCLPGTISGIPVGIAIFIDFFHYTPNAWLFPWFVVYNLALLGLTLLYVVYNKYKSRYSLSQWLTAYSVVMSLCAVMWAICVFLIPDNITRQYFAFIALFLIATGYSTGTIGQFFLCLTTLTIIVVPLVVWCFLKGTIFYNLVGFFSLIYIGFMVSINHRSTQWFKDSLKLKLENTLVSYQANHDLLTDLPNQRLLPQYIESAIQAVRDTGNTFAVVCFSLNRMEMINDSLGHQAGNAMIEAVARRLREFATAASARENAVRYTITISRKDTFNILVGPLKADQAVAPVDVLFSLLDDPIYLEKQGVKVTASMGVSLYGKDGEDAHALLINADAAMFRAKQYGGNRLEFYRAEINAEMPKQLELETDLHRAIEGNQLQVYYQPLVNLTTGEVSGMEALLRWLHPVHGFISPMQFIPLAEETGLIVPIGEWVMREACLQTKKWHEMGFTSLKVAVNLAEKQLRQDNLIATIQAILKQTGLSSAFLELEITETAILDEAVIHLIKDFKRLGLALAVDDFGTGYSGLSYLKRFSIDKLKIDQSFVRDIPGNNDSITIVSAIIAMAKELNVTTLAEGVETLEQLQFLRARGCGYMQGYYFSKPVDARAFTALLQEHRSLDKIT